MKEEFMVLGEIPKNHNCKIVVSLKSFNNRDFVDLRLFFQDVNGDYFPTRHGFIFDPKHLKDLIEILQRGLEA